ncbi:MAG: T9SS type A sorting domain-containing protein [Bacteroidota bacterium]|nr:T9SS type A sorting domain-containing protein [Bacteroidota bacterium]
MSSNNIFLAICLIITRFSFAQAPVLLSCNPTESVTGAKITISGTNLSSITGVTFAGIQLLVSQFQEFDANTFELTVPSITPGVCDFYMETAQGISNSLNFTVLSPPVVPQKATITGISSNYIEVDDEVTLSGVSFGTVTGVFFNGMLLNSSQYQAISNTELSLIIQPVSSIGLAQIKIANSVGISPIYNVSVSSLNIPKITSISPNSELPGGRITISGLNFTTIIGVMFGNTLATLSTTSDFGIGSFSIIVPNLAIGSQDIVVITPRGQSNPYIFSIPTSPPTITSLSDTVLSILKVFTINGSNFNSVLSVVLANYTTTSFRVNNSTSIVVTVPKGNLNGKVSVITAFGSATSSQSIKVDSNTNTIQEILLESSKSILTFYPNPTNGTIFSSEPIEMSQIKIINIYGNNILIEKPDYIQNSINLGNLTNGLYVITYKDSKYKIYVNR